MATGTAGKDGLKVKWILHSGATRPITSNLNLLTKIRVTKGSVEKGDGSVVEIGFIGTITEEAEVYGESRTILIDERALVQNLTISILSVRCMRRNDLEVIFKSDVYIFRPVRSVSYRHGIWNGRHDRCGT